VIRAAAEGRVIRAARAESRAIRAAMVASREAMVASREARAERFGRAREDDGSF